MYARVAKKTLLSSATSPFSAATAATKPSTSSPQTVVGWKAWYAGGRVYSSDSHTWESLPKDGVLGVVVYHEPPYRTIVSGGDWFWIEGDMPACGETTWDGWVDPPDVDPRLLKRGVGVPDKEYERVQEKMVQDKEWP